MPLPIKEVYECEDRNFILVAGAVIDEVISQRSEALRKAERTHG